MPSERFFSSQLNETTRTVTLTGDENHHLTAVSRQRPGDMVEILNGHGGIASAVVALLSKNRTELDVHSFSQLPRQSPAVHLAVAPPRRETDIDLVLRGAVEYGAAAVQFLLTDRSQGDLERLYHRRLDRWRKIIINCSKRSRQAWFPELRPPHTLEEYLRTVPTSATRIYAGMEPHIDLKTGPEKPGAPSATWVWLVGPEGGWSKSEIDRIILAGCHPLRIGDRILTTVFATFAGLIALELMRTSPAEYTGPPDTGNHR